MLDVLITIVAYAFMLLMYLLSILLRLSVILLVLQIFIGVIRLILSAINSLTLTSRNRRSNKKYKTQSIKIDTNNSRQEIICKYGSYEELKRSFTNKKALELLKAFKCCNIWYVYNTFKLQQEDRRRNGSAEKVIYRQLCDIIYYTDHFSIKTPFWEIQLYNNYININNINYGYDIIDIGYNSINFLDEFIPSDTKVRAKVWRYINDDGTPDNRFKNNIKFCVCSYVDIKLYVHGHILNFITSNSQLYHGMIHPYYYISNEIAYW